MSVVVNIRIEIDLLMAKFRIAMLDIDYIRHVFCHIFDISLVVNGQPFERPWKITEEKIDKIYDAYENVLRSSVSGCCNSLLHIVNNSRLNCDWIASNEAVQDAICSTTWWRNFTRSYWKWY